MRLSNFGIFWSLFLIISVLSVSNSKFFMIPVAFVIFESWRLWTRAVGVEWVPTPNHIIEKMLKMGNVKKDKVVYDLGSGDGKIVLKAAKLGAKAVGVEIDPLRVFISRIKLKLAGLDRRAKIIHGSFIKASVKEANLVTLYLLPKTMERIENKLRKELKKGAKVVSYRFVFKNWKPAKADKENAIYLYTK